MSMSKADYYRAVFQMLLEERDFVDTGIDRNKKEIEHIQSDQNRLLHERAEIQKAMNFLSTRLAEAEQEEG